MEKSPQSQSTDAPLNQAGAAVAEYPAPGDTTLPDPFSESTSFAFSGTLGGVRTSMGLFLEPLEILRHNNGGRYRASLIAVKRGGKATGHRRWEGFVQASGEETYTGMLQETQPVTSSDHEPSVVGIQITAETADRYTLAITSEIGALGTAQGHKTPTLSPASDSEYLPESSYCLQEIDSGMPGTRKLRFLVFGGNLSCDGIDYMVFEDRVEYGLRIGGRASGNPMSPSLPDGTGFLTAILAGAPTLPLMAFSANQALPWPWTDVGKCGPIEPGQTSMTRESVIKYREWRAIKRKWRRFVDFVVPVVQRINCPHFYICPALVLAILWDEMARGSCDTSEWIKDTLQEDIGGDPTCGPFQIRLSTAREIIGKFNIQTHHNVDADDDLQDALTEDLDFAATLVAYRICQLWNHWRNAGHDPCTQGGLGANHMTPSQLAAALYSQGLGNPKPNPGPNARGDQLVQWMTQIIADLGFPPCNPCDPNSVIRHPGPLPEAYWNGFDWSELTGAEQSAWKRLGWDEDSWAGDTPAPDTSTTPWEELTDDQRDAAADLGYAQESWDGA
ncbi:hypothetical protein [Porticoccus sp.]